MKYTARRLTIPIGYKIIKLINTYIFNMHHQLYDSEINLVHLQAIELKIF